MKIKVTYDVRQYNPSFASLKKEIEGLMMTEGTRMRKTLFYLEIAVQTGQGLAAMDRIKTLLDEKYPNWDIELEVVNVPTA